MATRNDEFAPDRHVIDRVVIDVIQPRMRAFEADGISPMFADLEIWVRETLVDAIRITSSTIDTCSIQANGQIRLRFRRTANPNRDRWRIESLFPNISPTTGFTGFDAAGIVKSGGNELEVRMHNWIGKYNIVKWHGWK